MRNKNIYKILLLITLLWNYGTKAQTGFVHIQSENGQPYNVQWNGYTYSSSGTGYLIIAKMPLGEQTMVIGFGKSQFPEYVFRYTLNDKARGFSLKLNIDNSWSLFDMVNFTTLKGKPVTAAEKEEIQKERERLAKANTPVDPKDNLYKVVEVKNPGIYKIFDKTTEEGRDLVYVVTNDNLTDTIVIFIPAPLPVQKPADINGRLVVPIRKGLPAANNKDILVKAVFTRRLIPSSN